MTAPITLPGTIPGLLRFGSPVRGGHDGLRIGVIVGTGSSLGLRILWCTGEGLEWECDASPIALDLTDPTGAVHAAWWALRTGRMTDESEYMLCGRACDGRPLSTSDLTRLRDLVLRLAGVTP